MVASGVSRAVVFEEDAVLTPEGVEQIGAMGALLADFIDTVQLRLSRQRFRFSFSLYFVLDLLHSFFVSKMFVCLFVCVCVLACFVSLLGGSECFWINGRISINCL